MIKIIKVTAVVLFLFVQSSISYAEKITIFGGTGAVGAYFAMQLVEAGHEVTILGRSNSDHLKQIQAQGLSIQTSEGIKNIPAEKFKYIGSYNQNIVPQDIIIVSLKQPTLNIDLAQQIKHISSDNTIIAIVANGLPFYFMQGLNVGDKHYLNSVDSNGEIINLLKINNLIGVQPFIASEILDLGVIKITRPLDKISIVIGSATDINEAVLTKTAGVFQDAKIKCTISPEKMHKNILEKLQFALTANVLSALMDKPTDEVFVDPNAQPFIRYVIHLLERISNASQVGNLRDYDQFKALPITKGHYSSLYKDMINNKPNESAAIVDASLELATYLAVNNSISHVDLEPLIYLRALLLRKSRGAQISKQELEKLFSLCEKYD